MEVTFGNQAKRALLKDGTVNRSKIDTEIEKTYCQYSELYIPSLQRLLCVWSFSGEDYGDTRESPRVGLNSTATIMIADVGGVSDDHYPSLTPLGVQHGIRKL